jgi:hypothetical protein
MEYIDQGLSSEIIRRLYTMQLVRCQKQRLAGCTKKLLGKWRKMSLPVKIKVSKNRNRNRRLE